MTTKNNIRKGTHNLTSASSISTLDHTKVHYLSYTDKTHYEHVKVNKLPANACFYTINNAALHKSDSYIDHRSVQCVPIVWSMLVLRFAFTPGQEHTLIMYGRYSSDKNYSYIQLLFHLIWFQLVVFSFHCCVRY